MVATAQEMFESSVLKLIFTIVVGYNNLTISNSCYGHVNIIPFTNDFFMLKALSSFVISRNTLNFKFLKMIHGVSEQDQ